MKISIILLISAIFIFSPIYHCAPLPHRHKNTSPSDTLLNKYYLYSSLETQKDNPTWYQMFTHLPSDYYQFFHRSFTTKNLPTLAAIAAATGSFLILDQSGWSFNRKLYNSSPIVRKTSDLAVIMGNGTYQFIGGALFAVSGLLLKDHTALRTGSNIAEAILSTGLFVQLLKRITGRESPIASSERGGEWDMFPSIKEYQKHQPEFYSFPSGHLSTATAIFTVISNNYPDVKWIKPVGYSLLGILSLSLVNKGMHWYSDLPLAYFLGYSFGNIIAPVRTLPVKSSNKTSLSILPSISQNGFQLQMNYSF